MSGVQIHTPRPKFTGLYIHMAATADRFARYRAGMDLREVCPREPLPRHSSPYLKEENAHGARGRPADARRDADRRRTAERVEVKSLFADHDVGAYGEVADAIAGKVDAAHSRAEAADRSYAHVVSQIESEARLELGVSFVAVEVVTEDEVRIDVERAGDGALEEGVLELTAEIVEAVGLVGQRAGERPSLLPATSEAKEHRRARRRGR